MSGDYMEKDLDDCLLEGICFWENNWCLTHDTDHGIGIDEKEPWEEA